jgi:hypothetical protein
MGYDGDMSIDHELLKKTRKIIVHADCPDGVASAMILHDALPDAEVVAVQYGPERDALEPEPGLLFCDMTPPEKTIYGFIDARAVVLDHHKTQRCITEDFAERDHGVYADNDGDEPGVGGALLAYREVWRRMRHMGATQVGQSIKHFATLAGIRDTWQRESPLWLDACAQAEVLMFYPLEHWIDADFTGPRLTEEELRLGHTLLDKKLRRAREIAESGCLRIGNAALFNADGRIVSDVAEAMREVDPSVEIVAGFFYTAHGDQMNLVFSLRSSPGGPDVSAIAKTMGGGGHAHAAGFTVPMTCWSPGPPAVWTVACA